MTQSLEPIESASFQSLCNRLRNLHQFQSGEADKRTMCAIIEELAKRMRDQGFPCLQVQR
jgi:hypothetical protein